MVKTADCYAFGFADSIFEKTKSSSKSKAQMDQPNPFKSTWPFSLWLRSFLQVFLIDAVQQSKRHISMLVVAHKGAFSKTTGKIIFSFRRRGRGQSY